MSCVLQRRHSGLHTDIVSSPSCESVNGAQRTYHELAVVLGVSQKLLLQLLNTLLQDYLLLLQLVTQDAHCRDVVLLGSLIVLKLPDTDVKQILLAELGVELGNVSLIELTTLLKTIVCFKRY